jgi:hypothetical protein
MRIERWWGAIDGASVSFLEASGAVGAVGRWFFLRRCSTEELLRRAWLGRWGVVRCRSSFPSSPVQALHNAPLTGDAEPGHSLTHSFPVARVRGYSPTMSRDWWAVSDLVPRCKEGWGVVPIPLPRGEEGGWPATPLPHGQGLACGQWTPHSHHLQEPWSLFYSPSPLWFQTLFWCCNRHLDMLQSLYVDVAWMFLVMFNCCLQMLQLLSIMLHECSDHVAVYMS